MSAPRLSRFRRYALAYVLLQGALLAFGPLAEARLARPADTLGVEQAHDSHCVPLHQAEHCAFCQIAGARVRKSEGTILRVPGRETRFTAPPSRRELVGLPSPSLLRSRAPPPLAG
jgi:hypothetical protein